MATTETPDDGAKIIEQFGKDPKDMSKDEFVQLLKNINTGTITETAPIDEIGTRSNLKAGEAIAFLPTPNNGDA